MKVNRSTQRGLTLTGLIFAGFFIAIVAVLGMKVVPHVVEYGKIMANIKAIAGDAGLQGASVAEVHDTQPSRSPRWAWPRRRRSTSAISCGC